MSVAPLSLRQRHCADSFCVLGSVCRKGSLQLALPATPRTAHHTPVRSGALQSTFQRCSKSGWVSVPSSRDSCPSPLCASDSCLWAPSPMEGGPAAPRPSFHAPCQGHMAYFWKGCEQSAQACGWTTLPKVSGVDGLALHSTEDLKIQKKKEPQPPAVPSACACQCEVGAPQPGLSLASLSLLAFHQLQRGFC